MEISYQEMQSIQAVNFTPKEVDVIACLLSGKDSKGIAAILSISSKTVDTHIQNVMRKADCNSRQRIINFIETSNKFENLKRHYLYLMSNYAFEKKLQPIRTTLNKLSITCSVMDEVPKKEDKFIIEKLKKHLELSGIKVIPTSNLDKEILLEKTSAEATIFSFHTIYIVSGNVEKSLRDIAQTKLSGKHRTFVILNPELLGSFPVESHILQESVWIDTTNYSASFAQLLERICADLAEEDKKLISNLKQGEVQDSLTQNLSLSPHNHVSEDGSKEALPKENFKGNRDQLFKSVLLFMIGIGVLSAAVALYNSSAFFIHSHSSPLKPIKADLCIPAEGVLLKRSKLLEQIYQHLKSGQGIKVLSITGAGGAGKTTLAREYARLHKASLIWEINAETQEALRHSFEQLAYLLAESKTDRDKLREIEEIKDSKEKEEKITFFIKERIKTYSPWLLIFDNVEEFSDIQNNFPYNSDTWGEGSIILTTRNSTIQNKYITATIPLNELDFSQAISLFAKINGYEDLALLKEPQRKEIEKLLRNIPLFPLDVICAAYYIKATGVDYKTYLEYLKEATLQSPLLYGNILDKEKGYFKTRYNVISRSLHQVMDSQAGFSELLLFISLIDSKNIPRKLLEAYAGKLNTDLFVASLKRYSLITEETSSGSEYSFSIHRNTQDISLKFLQTTLNLKAESAEIKKISSILEKYLSDSIDKDDISILKQSIEHLEKLLSHHNLLTGSLRGALKGLVGRIYLFEGNNLKAKDLLEESVITLNNAVSKDYRRLGRILAYLGIVYKNLGDYGKAENFFERSLSIYRQHFPENHPDITWVLAYAGDIYRELGDYEKAKTFLEQSLWLQEKYFPENQGGIARNLVMLGNTYIAIKDYKNAELVLTKSLHIFKKEFSENHTGVAFASSILGNCYMKMEQYEKARDILEQALEIYRLHFSDTHIAIARTFSYLGAVYIKLGVLEKAKNYLRKSLQTCEKNYGKDHKETIAILNSLTILDDKWAKL